MRTIKKYSNRRLYDTEISAYVTLEDIKELVNNFTEFQILDAKTNQDITAAVMLQIITDQEISSGSPVFTNQVLQHLIRLYSMGMQGIFSEHLERGLEVFLAQQDAMKKQFGDLWNYNPMQMMNEMAKKNLEIWQSGQKKTKE